MDGDENNTKNPNQMVREHLKIMLLHFAKSSETPGEDLQALLHELIEELYVETKKAIQPKRHLKMIATGGPSGE